MADKPYLVRRCQAAVYHKDCYRVDRRAGVSGGFSMHYTRDQCKRPSINQTPDIDPHKLAARPWATFKQVYLCCQHLNIFNRSGAAKPETAAYHKYVTTRPAKT